MGELALERGEGPEPGGAQAQAGTDSEAADC